MSAVGKAMGAPIKLSMYSGTFQYSYQVVGDVFGSDEHPARRPRRRSMTILRPTADISVTSHAELMVAQVEGLTDKGTNFVDAYVHSEMVVLDAGRIIIPLDSLADLLTDAKRGGLGVEVNDITVGRTA